jgi:hypothetical protein
LIAKSLDTLHGYSWRLGFRLDRLIVFLAKAQALTLQSIINEGKPYLKSATPNNNYH